MDRRLSDKKVVGVFVRFFVLFQQDKLFNKLSEWYTAFPKASVIVW
jgi:predicted HAD superfamily hydrolase